MRERQKLDEDAHDLGQSLRRKERAAEERHRQQNVCIDLPHLFVCLDLHRRDESNLREDHAVQHEHEEKERGKRELRAEKAGERDDDGRGNESAQYGREHLADDEGRRTDRRDEVLFKALVVNALGMHGNHAVETDVHGIEREDARHEEVEIGAGRH